MKLADFLARAGATPFSYGSHDCSLWLADWVLDQRGIDGAAALRGRYRTALGCARLVARGGGLVAVVGRCAQTAGLSSAKLPRPGDVGIVKAVTDDGTTLVGAILADATRWAVLGAAGLRIEPATCVAAWRV